MEEECDYNGITRSRDRTGTRKAKEKSCIKNPPPRERRVKMWPLCEMRHLPASVL
jgi:hypothetical protein